MSLYDDFKNDPTAAQSVARMNPDGDPLSEPLKFLFWVASKRDGKQNPPSEEAAIYWDLDAIEEAGEEMGLSGLALQAFTQNAATWF